MKGDVLYMDDIISNKLYFVFLGILIFIVITNYKNLNNPRPYPPKKIREEFKRGKKGFSSYKYRGFSHYSLPRLVKSESNWINGNAYWNSACIKLGIMGVIIALITMILGEVVNFYNSFVGVSIILAYLLFGMTLISYRMEKNILKD